MASLNPVDQSSIFAQDVQFDEGQILLLRHAKPLIDPEISPVNWELSPEGRSQAKHLLEDSRIMELDYIFCSPEKRAIQTAQPLSDDFGVKIVEVEGLREAHLDKFYTETEFRSFKEIKFEDPNLEIGEPHSEAQLRIIDTIEGLRSYVRGKSVIVVSHGTVISLYMAYLNKWTVTQTKHFWRTLDYCHIEDISR